MNTLLQKKKVISIGALIVILLAIPLTIFLSRQEQDTRQRASGRVYTSAPSNYSLWKDKCYEPYIRIQGLSGCVSELSINGKIYTKVTNTSTDKTFSIGFADYKAYYPYSQPSPWCSSTDCPENYEWIWTQTLYDYIQGITLGPQKTIYIEINAPSCAWNGVVFVGSVLQKFSPSTGDYTTQGRFIDGFFNTSLPVCKFPTPTPTKAPTPTPTKVPTPTPTRIPPTPTPTPKPPTLSFTSTATSIGYNGSITLKWSGSNITSCTASGAWTGSKPTSGSQTFSGLTSTRTYTLTCSGPGGTITNSITIKVGAAPTPTPTRTPTPTPTRTPTPTPTKIPTPTATPVPQSTTFSLTLYLHGIGNSGDNANPNQYSLSNKNPLRKSRSVQVEIYNSSDTLILSKAGTVNYDSTSGNFKGTVNMGTTLSSGSYIVRVKSPYYLKRRVSGIVSITAARQNNLSPITLVTGDINNDNVLSILDYNILVGCYSDFGPPVSCATGQKQQADITDDGNVDQFDYNLFLRDFSVQLGD